MITIEQCKCGFKGRNGQGCKDYWLVGVGKFCQGSGFTRDEAQNIANLLNAQAEADKYRINNAEEFFLAEGRTQELEHLLGSGTLKGWQIMKYSAELEQVTKARNDWMARSKQRILAGNPDA